MAYQLEAKTYAGAKKPVPDALPIQEIYQAPLNAHLDRGKTALIYALYLTAARASEINRITASDFQVKPNPETGENEVTVRVPTLKNPRVIKREVIIPVYNPWEAKMWETLGALGRYRLEHEQDLMFPLDRFQIYRASRKIAYPAIAKRDNQTLEFEFKTNPHYWRHCRLTHLVEYYHFDDFDLMTFAGWSSTDPARTYVNKDWLAMARKFHFGSFQPRADSESKPSG